MSLRNVRIIIMEGFGARFANYLDMIGMTPRQAALRSGVDYPFVTRLINNPAKDPTPETLSRFERVPELKQFITNEKIDQLIKNYGPETVVEATLRFLKSNPERGSDIRDEVISLLSKDKPQD